MKNLDIIAQLINVQALEEQDGGVFLLAEHADTIGAHIAKQGAELTTAQQAAAAAGAQLAAAQTELQNATTTLAAANEALAEANTARQTLATENESLKQQLLNRGSGEGLQKTGAEGGEPKKKYAYSEQRFGKTPE